MSKHKKFPDCPGCYPARAWRLAQAQSRRRGGYSPQPRCPAHQIKMGVPPKDPAGVTRAS